MDRTDLRAKVAEIVVEYNRTTEDRVDAIMGLLDVGIAAEMIVCVEKMKKDVLDTMEVACKLRLGHDELIKAGFAGTMDESLKLFREAVKLAEQDNVKQ